MQKGGRFYQKLDKFGMIPYTCTLLEHIIFLPAMKSKQIKNFTTQMNLFSDPVTFITT